MLGFGEDRLSIYLNDHLGGATAGVNLARRLARNNRSSATGEALASIAAEIEHDRELLLEVMARLAVGRDRVKAALGWGAEKAARLKLTGEPLGHTALSRLEELEALSLGVEGKLALWTALRHTHGSDARLAGIDLEELATRARSQRRRLEQQRTRAAKDAFVSGSP